MLSGISPYRYVLLTLLGSLQTLSPFSVVSQPSLAFDAAYILDGLEINTYGKQILMSDVIRDLLTLRRFVSSLVERPVYCTGRNIDASVEVVTPRVRLARRNPTFASSRHEVGK